MKIEDKLCRLCSNSLGEGGFNFTRVSLKYSEILLSFDFSFRYVRTLLYRSNTYTRLKAVTWTVAVGARSTPVREIDRPLYAPD